MSKKFTEYDDSENKILEDQEIKNMTFYKVLGVTHNANLDEIKKQFRKLAIKYHPDHKETGDASIFALVARAYECLSDSEKRSEYNKMLSIQKKTKKMNFNDQKKAFDDFLKAQNQSNNEKDTNKKKKYMEAQYKLEYEKMDKRRGFDRSKMEDIPMKKEDSIKRIRDLEMAREQDDIEFIQPKIFDEDTVFDPIKFQTLFELKYKDKDESKLAKYKCPAPFNEIGDNSNMGCNFDTNGNGEGYDDLFIEEENDNTNYGTLSRDLGINKKVRVTADDIKKLRASELVTDYNAHNYNDEGTKADLERRLNERISEDKLYEAGGIHDFNDDPEMGGYGFLHQVGLTGKELEWDKDDIDEHAVKKLISHQKSERQYSRSHTTRATIGKKKKNQ